MRAIVDAIGLGAPQSSLAIYPFTVTDRDLHPLSGVNRYVVRFSAQDLPFPVRAFWSLTLYDSSGFFVPNRAGIYSSTTARTSTTTAMARSTSTSNRARRANRSRGATGCRRPPASRSA
jgi:hypothetical protein